VIESKSAAVPGIARVEKADPHRQEILDLLTICEGNLVRVHEELVAGNVALSYSTLTAFCRREGIGQEPKTPVGRYHFEPGQEQLCGIPHSCSYAAPGNMRRPSKPMALMAGGDAAVV
jgi:hypothetical protein